MYALHLRYEFNRPKALIQLSNRHLSVARSAWLVSTSEKVDTLQKRFGKIVRARRQAMGLSQEALADEAGLHRTYISMLERGERMPSIGVVRKLAIALQTTMASLVAELDRRELRARRSH